MRENETRIGGLQWGLFSIFEPSEPRPGRCIDQSVVAWRLASRAAGKSAFENPRSTIQRTVNMITGGSNREHHARLQDSIQPLRSICEPIRYSVSPDLFESRPYNPEEFVAPIIHRRRAMTAGEVRMQMQEEEAREASVRRPGFRYPTEAEVSEIQRRFHDPELQEAMNREFARRMAHLMSEPAPPGFREAMRGWDTIHNAD